MSAPVFDPTALPKRLGCVIAAAGRRPGEVAAAIGVSACTLTRTIAGRSGMQARTLAAVCRELDISADYLLGLDDLQPRHHDISGRDPADGWLP